MNLRDIQDKLKSIKELEKDLILAEILKNNPRFSVTAINKTDDGLRISKKYSVNGFDFEDDGYINYEEEISIFVLSANRTVEYIEKLWKDYPEFCEATERLREYSFFSIPGVNTRLMLTDQLILPSRVTYNQTNTFSGGGGGCGGGDYEVKRTPQRVKKYIENSDKLIYILEKSLLELKKRRKEVASLQLVPNDF